VDELAELFVQPHADLAMQIAVPAKTCTNAVPAEIGGS